MSPLIHAGLAGTAICTVIAGILLYKKNPLWKNAFIGVLVCLILFLTGNVVNPIEERQKIAATSKKTAPLLEYQLLLVDIPTDKEVEIWSKGELKALAYTIFVEKSDPSPSEFETIISELLDKNAKTSRNWNIVYFYLRTPESAEKSSAYMTAIYALNGKSDQSSQIKPGQYSNRYDTVIKRVF